MKVGGVITIPTYVIFITIIITFIPYSHSINILGPKWYMHAKIFTSFYFICWVGHGILSFLKICRVYFFDDAKDWKVFRVFIDGFRIDYPLHLEVAHNVVVLCTIPITH